MEVKGNILDAQTRCIHFHSEKDIIAIKFKCCGDYYPCFECHREAVSHETERWSKVDFDEIAVLCGQCQYELQISEYLESNNMCPHCQAAFNPNCSKHYYLYFEV